VNKHGKDLQTLLKHVKTTVTRKLNRLREGRFIVKRFGTMQFIAGIIVGALIFGGTTAYAISVLAQPKTAEVWIDGQEVNLKGYLIDGSHYFQLRDLDAKLVPGGKDFSVVWDGGGNRIIIDTTRRYDPNEQYTPAPPLPAAPKLTMEEMKAEIVRLANAERVKAGVSVVEVLPALADCAQAKADDLRDSGYYGHTSPVYGTAGDMIFAAIPEVTAYAENLAPWTKTPAEAFQGWVESSRHYASIINPKYTHIGIGVVEGVEGGYWWVMQLVKI
jgi:uncharacterized protein YkwD